MWPGKQACQHFESVASVILRVPGIFILDYWWQYDKLWPSSLQWHDVVSILLSLLIPIQGVLLLLLRLEQLVDLYMHYIAASLLVAAHVFSTHYLTNEKVIGSTVNAVLTTDPDSAIVDDSFLKRQLAALLIHITICLLVSFLLSIPHAAHRMMLAAFCLPVVARLSGFPVSELQVFQNFASAFMILQVIYYVLKYVPTVVAYTRYVYNGLSRALEVYGWLGVSIAMWNSLFIPAHFLLFWSIQVVSHLYLHVHVLSISPVSVVNPVAVTNSQPLTIQATITAASTLHHDWYLVLLKCISEICASPVSLAATAVSISYLSYMALTATKFFLQGYNAFVNDTLMHSGWTEGLAMVLLALQTGLIELRMPHRAAVMSIILFIVISSLIQSMFEITEPILLALSASHSRCVGRHARTLALCAFLFFFPLYMTLMLCQVFLIDFWMLVVISSCIMTSVQVSGLVVIYLLFMYDSMRAEPWEMLDDVVYGARAITRVLEFIVAVFVVGAGLRESMMGQWSWINSSILLIHCYFNVWQRLQSGWKSFLLRREAVRKIESLPVASEQELNAYGDVCAICYGEMKLARVTGCKHLYHGTCLRKWLYVQDKCPMCHQVISPDSDSPAHVQHGIPSDHISHPNPHRTDTMS